MHTTAATIHNSCLTPFLLKTTELYTFAPPIIANGTGGQGQNKRLSWSMTQEDARLERRHQIAKMLSALLDIISASHSLAPVLAYIVAQTEPLLAATACALYRLDKGGDALALQSSCGLPPSFTTFAHLPLAGKPAVKAALTENRPLVIPALVRDPLDLDVASPSCRQMLFASGAYTMLIVPLMVHDERYGALFLYFVDLFEFTEEEVALAMTFGRKAACGIESALAWQVDTQAVRMAEQERVEMYP